MHFLNIPLRKFWLHDSGVESIICDNSQIVLGFRSGFYNENHEQLNNCKMLLSIDGLNKQNFACFCSIRSRAILSKEITLKKFEKWLKRNEFIIEVDYYSEFERSILLLGYMHNKQIEIKVTDVSRIDFSFDFP